MKFGVVIVPHDLKKTAVSAKLAEDLGFAYIGIPDSQSLWRERYLIRRFGTEVIARL